VVKEVEELKRVKIKTLRDKEWTIKNRLVLRDKSVEIRWGKGTNG